ncbi:MAG: hypothetical protein GYA21_15710 [Myxococcales bacterium]|nr:hypothetical protein [Myxococcales bacterium]
MNAKKVQARENRLSRVKAQLEERKKLLAARGLDAKNVEKDVTIRALKAEVREVLRSIEALKWEPPKVEASEKPEKPAKPEKGEKGGKPAKEAKPKGEKPPKEKKPPKPEESTPAA